MNVLQHKFIKFCFTAFCVSFAMMFANLAQASDDDEEARALKLQKKVSQANDFYMRNIRPVYFPAVPYGWKIEINDDNVVSYIHEKSANTESSTTINMRYTRDTQWADAAAFMDSYISQHSCEDKSQVGKGFYTTSCGVTNTYAIVIGEPNNLYLIELIGNYNSASSAIISNYVNSIVTGKKVFKDRNIGEQIQN